MRQMLSTAIGCVTLLWVGTAAAATDACQASKNKAAGKYAICRQSAEAKLVASGDAVKYGESILKCESKFAKAWQKAIDKATAAGVACLDAPLIAADYKAVIDAYSDNIAMALGGGGLVASQTCANNLSEGSEVCDGTDLNSKTCATEAPATPYGSLACNASCTGFVTTGCSAYFEEPACANDLAEGTEVCDGTDLNSKTCATEAPATPYGTLACNAGCTAFVTTGCVARFEQQVVGADATVVDHLTGLEWVKTRNLDGIATADLLDADNAYTWNSSDTYPHWPNGTAFTTYIAGLNAMNGGAGYGGHNDWRLPTTGGTYWEPSRQAGELGSILDGTQGRCGGGSGPCLNQSVFGPTQSNFYWTTTIDPYSYLRTYGVWFDRGHHGSENKVLNYYVRAVRSGR